MLVLGLTDRDLRALVLEDNITFSSVFIASVEARRVLSDRLLIGGGGVRARVRVRLGEGGSTRSEGDGLNVKLSLKGR